MNKTFLGDIAISQTGPFGSQLHEEDYVEVGTPIVTVEHLGDLGFTTQNLPYVSDEDVKRLSKYTVKEGDIVFSRVGAIDRNTYVTKSEDGWMFSGRCIRVRCDNTKVNSRYLSYYFKLNSFKKMMLNVSVGATMPSLNTKIMDSLPLYLRPLPEQKHISAILESIDNKIINNNAIIKTSEKLMREIFDYWFVQFDFPNEKGYPYKSSGGEMFFDKKLKREIPKGWKVQNLLKNDLCKAIKPGIDKFEDTKTYYATADVLDDEMGIGAEIDYDNRESRANMQPKPNSVWFAKMKNSVKHITVMPTSNDLLEKSVFSTGFFGLKCESETLPYIRNFIYSDYFEKVKDLNSHGATMEAISNDGVKNIKLIIPDEITLKNYHDITYACLTQNDILRKENAKLISLRDWLLPMLMNGQVKIKD